MLSRCCQGTELLSQGRHAINGQPSLRQIFCDQTSLRVRNQSHVHQRPCLELRDKNPHQISDGEEQEVLLFSFLFGRRGFARGGVWRFGDPLRPGLRCPRRLLRTLRTHPPSVCHPKARIFLFVRSLVRHLPHHLENERSFSPGNRASSIEASVVPCNRQPTRSVATRR